jgi:hypothetical protein
LLDAVCAKAYYPYINNAHGETEMTTLSQPERERIAQLVSEIRRRELMFCMALEAKNQGAMQRHNDAEAEATVALYDEFGIELSTYQQSKQRLEPEAA